MQETEYAQIKGKIVGGVLVLSSRNFFLNIVSFIANFFLTIFLSPEIFGVFFVVSAVVSFFSYFSDVGLAAALIQKKEEPTRAELVSVFTLQQLLVGSIVLISYYFSPQIAQYNHLNSDGLFLLRILIISFFLSSLKTIPSILLERKLEFGLLVVPQIIETLVYYIVAIFLAFLNFGIASFAWAALLRGVVGLIAIYIISPWRISLGFSVYDIKGLLTFGIPFQANSFLALIKDDLLIIFLGGYLPVPQFQLLGFIGWAKKWAETPLRIIMDGVMRVTFPAYSRLQGDRIRMKKALEKTIFYLAYFIFPATVMMIIFVKPLVDLIPNYSKWVPAIPSFYLFALMSVFAAFSSPIVNALNSIGNIRTTLALMIMWTGLTWLLVPFFVRLYSFQGVAVAMFIISITSIFPIVIMKRIVNFNFFSEIYKPLAATLIMAVPVALSVIFINGMTGIILGLVCAVLIYGGLTIFWMRRELDYLNPYFKRMWLHLRK